MLVIYFLTFTVLLPYVICEDFLQTQRNAFILIYGNNEPWLSSSECTNAGVQAKQRTFDTFLISKTKRQQILESSK